MRHQRAIRSALSRSRSAWLRVPRRVSSLVSLGQHGRATLRTCVIQPVGEAVRRAALRNVRSSFSAAGRIDLPRDLPPGPVGRGAQPLDPGFGLAGAGVEADSPVPPAAARSRFSTPSARSSRTAWNSVAASSATSTISRSHCMPGIVRDAGLAKLNRRNARPGQAFRSVALAITLETASETTREVTRRSSPSAPSSSGCGSLRGRCARRHGSCAGRPCPRTSPPRRSATAPARPGRRSA